MGRGELAGSATATSSKKPPKTKTLSPTLTLLPTWHPAGMMRYKAKAARSFLLHLHKAVKVATGHRRDDLPKIVVNPPASLVRKKLREWEAFASDIETPSLDSSRIISIAISGEAGMALVWDPEVCDLRETPLPLAYLSRTHIKVVQNGSFDLPIMEANGLRVEKVGKGGENLIWDTVIEAQILHPDEPANLSFLASVALDVEAWKHAKEDLFFYNGLDANYTYRIYERGAG